MLHVVSQGLTKSIHTRTMQANTAERFLFIFILFFKSTKVGLKKEKPFCTVNLNSRLVSSDLNAKYHPLAAAFKAY